MVPNTWFTSSNTWRIDEDTDPPPAARSGEHRHHARGGFRMREAGNSLLHRQRHVGHAASGGQGGLPVETALPTPPCRHYLEVSGNVRISRYTGAAAQPRDDRSRASPGP